ncbi:uracil phosphoribosyltransferase [Abditibacteriota bacterium]|nr:uracil phosphoribosyltransferase [Abditibacteriota bacterium]
MSSFPQAHVPDHPFISHYIAKCRDTKTGTIEFRAAVVALGQHLTYECCRDWLPTSEVMVPTPLGVETPGRIIDNTRQVEIVPILRAGLALVEGCLPLLPDAKILHVGYRRDEETAQATCYLTRLPSQLPEGARYLILEPMLATGGTLIQVLDAMHASGAREELVRVISLIASKPALERIAAHYPNVQIFCAAIDPEVNGEAFIVPGLGDAGDRAFGTD